MDRFESGNVRLKRLENGNPRLKRCKSGNTRFEIAINLQLFLFVRKSRVLYMLCRRLRHFNYLNQTPKTSGTRFDEGMRPANPTKPKTVLISIGNIDIVNNGNCKQRPRITRRRCERRIQRAVAARRRFASVSRGACLIILFIGGRSNANKCCVPTNRCVCPDRAAKFAESAFPGPRHATGCIFLRESRRENRSAFLERQTQNRKQNYRNVSKNSEIVSVCSFSWERFRFYFSMIAALEFRRFDRCIVNVTFDVCDEVNIMQSAARVAVNLQRE